MNLRRCHDLSLRTSVGKVFNALDKIVRTLPPFVGCESKVRGGFNLLGCVIEPSLNKSIYDDSKRENPEKTLYTTFTFMFERSKAFSLAPCFMENSK